MGSSAVNQWHSTRNRRSTRNRCNTVNQRTVLNVKKFHAEVEVLIPSPVKMRTGFSLSQSANVLRQRQKMSRWRKCGCCRCDRGNILLFLCVIKLSTCGYTVAILMMDNLSSETPQKSLSFCNKVSQNTKHLQLLIFSFTHNSTGNFVKTWEFHLVI